MNALETLDRAALRRSAMRLADQLDLSLVRFMNLKPIPDAERWMAHNGDIAVVSEHDLSRDHRTITLDLEMFHRLMTQAGYTRTDTISPEDLA